MVCEDCGKNKPDVQERECGYDADVNNEVRLEVVCDECEDKHCDDI